MGVSWGSPAWAQGQGATIVWNRSFQKKYKKQNKICVLAQSGVLSGAIFPEGFDLKRRDPARMSPGPRGPAPWALSIGPWDLYMEKLWPYYLMVWPYYSLVLAIPSVTVGKIVDVPWPRSKCPPR